MNITELEKLLVKAKCLDHDACINLPFSFFSTMSPTSTLTSTDTVDTELKKCVYPLHAHLKLNGCMVGLAHFKS